MSHLTIGTSKIPAKPPRGQPPCTEPYVKGANVLSDSGIELQLANYGGGPGGNELPSWGFAGWVWSDGTTAPRPRGVYKGTGVPAQRRDFTISSDNPQTGTYHLRTRYTPSSPLGLQPVTVTWREFDLCIDNQPATARVEPGDFVSFGFSAVISENYLPSHNLLADLRVEWISAGGSSGYGSVGPLWNFTGTWANYRKSTFVPALIGGYVPAFCRMYLVWERGTTTDAPDMVIDIDDCVLEVS